MNINQAMKQAKAAGVSREDVTCAMFLRHLSVSYLLTKWQEQPEKRELFELGICYRYEYLDKSTKDILTFL